jgi:tricorn protease
VAPDLEVPLDPLAVNAGNDVQLDAAIADVLQQLKSSPQIPLKSAPAMPTHVGN